MSHHEFITWAAGRNDAMGLPFADWLVAVHGADGRAMRDTDDRVVYETQVAWLARQAAPINPPAAPVQLGLFT